MAPDLSLSPDRRLQSSSQIQAILESGDISKGRHCHLFRGRRDDGLTRAAFVVSEKSAARATLRNRIKRLMRESFRLMQPDFEQEGWPLVFVATRSVHSDLSRQDFDEDIRDQLQRADVIPDNDEFS